MVKVCDAIMGSGKSESAISYMNAHPEKRFIYITPYLPEATRIKEGCPELHFIEPSDKIRECGFTKAGHTMALVRQGRNVASTHQAFAYYKEDTLAIIREMGYTLIIDEEVDILREAKRVHPSDINILIESGYIREEDGCYVLTGKEYDGERYKDVFRILLSQNLMKTVPQKKGSAFYWMFTPELLQAFDEVFVLTYLFEGQDMSMFLQMYDIPYRYIGIHRTESGGYEFADAPEYIPEYTKHLKDMIHIFDNERLNLIGKKRYSLSKGWYGKKPKKNEKDHVKQLKNNVYNFFFSYYRDVPPENRAYGSYKEGKSPLRGKGYWNGFVMYNQRAVNDLRHKTALAYCVNLYMNIGVKRFFESYGFKPDEDTYALSIMIQWIWRSAIRDGKEIHIYVPSKRMRELLINWIDKTSKGE